jgi:hypothetical protein
MSYADECYEHILGLPPTRPAAERTPEERRDSLQRFFAIMESLSDKELADNPLAGRPLNISILDDGHSEGANAA